MAPTAWPGNRILAIGIPLAMLFFDPQNTMAISSSLLKPSQRLISVVETRTRPSSTASSSRIRARLETAMWDQTPATTLSLKAE